MGTLLIALGAGAAYLVAYHTYGKWLARKIFKLDPDATMPSVALNDDKDYVPTDKGVVFGHHFTSIAGTGPIVGPAIAVIWGWVPALLWVLFGSIFIGAVHDFGSLVVSMRNRGQTVGDIAGRVLNKRVRLLFLFILFMALTVVLAIFGLVIAAVFKMYPASIFPCLIQIPLAIAIGMWLHRKGVDLKIPSMLALAAMYLTVIWGNAGILGQINAELASWSVLTWCFLLLGYSYVASVLPVWTLLQPRDYINSLQLLTALALVVVGLLVAGLAGGAPAVDGAERQALSIVAPAFKWDPAGAPFIFPILFITIACGACSGFHCLVSSGTSSKQLRRETDAHFVGYGSMLTEGFLATLVILACVAGLGMGAKLKFPVQADGSFGPVAVETATHGKMSVQPIGEDAFRVTRDGQASDVPVSEASAFLAGGLALGSAKNGEAYLLGKDAYANRYASWKAAKGLSAKVGAFVDGSANFLRAMGIPIGIAIALMGVLVASFAATTLDTACRLQRYVIQELASTFAPRISPTAAAAEAYDFDDNVEGADRRTGEAADHRPHAWNPLVWLTNKHGATVFAVLVAGFVAALPPTWPEQGFVAALSAGEGWDWLTTHGGKGGLILWPLFGATNQLLAGLAFLVICFWMWRRSLPVWFIAIPMVFMLFVPAAAMGWQVVHWINSDTPNAMLIGIGIATLVLEAWMVTEAILLWPTARGVLESQLAPLKPVVASEPQSTGGRSC